MEKMTWLDDFKGKIDEVEVGRMVNKLNLHPLDMLAIAAAVVERRGTRKDRHQKRKATAVAIHENTDGDDDDDDDDDYEAAMFKHERRLERNISSISDLSWYPRKKLKTHVDEINGIVCSDGILKKRRLRREKKYKKPIILDESDLPLPLEQGNYERGSSSSSAFICSSFSSKKKRKASDMAACSSDSPCKQEELKRETLFKNPTNTPLPKKPKNPKEKKTVRIAYKGPATLPDLPDRFKLLIAELGGTKIQLVIQKPLYKTDLSYTHCRLSMPLSQIMAVNFLTDAEHEYLNKQSKGNIPGMDVALIDTNLVRGNITLKRWNLNKDSGKSNAMYALTTRWNELVVNNGLKCGNIVQVWSFRVESKLCLALVLVEEDGIIVNGDGNIGSTSTGTGADSSSAASLSKEDTQLTRVYM